MYDFFEILASILGGYSTLIIVRIILSWTGVRRGYNAFLDLLMDLTDPFLNIFRRLPLSIGFIDFSAIVALFALQMLQNLLRSLAVGQPIKPQFFISFLLITLWNILQSILFFLGLMILIRLISLIAFPHSQHRFFMQLDSLLYRIVGRLVGIFTSRRLKYRTGLIISLACIIGFYFILLFFLSLLGFFFAGL